MKPFLLFATLIVGLIALPARANLLIDGDFSTLPGSGNPAPAEYNANAGTFQYVAEPTGGGPTGTATNIGGPGGWTATNASGAGFSAVNVEDTLTTNAMDWVPQAAVSNTNGYVVQLDTIAHNADAGAPGTTGFITGNAISQNISVTAGQLYSLTFSINTEAGADKAGTSAADVMITNANILNNGGAEGTVLTSNLTNRNAFTYGDVTGLEYTVTTTGDGGSADTWQTYTLTFSAVSTGTTELTFADDTMNNVDNSNVALEDITLVPEPREWALIVLLGIGGLVAVRKLRDRFFRLSPAA